MEHKKCEICSSLFYKKTTDCASEWKQKRFCSQKCRLHWLNKDKNGSIEYKCIYCKKDNKAFKSKYSQSINHFCNKECEKKYKTSKEYPNKILKNTIRQSRHNISLYKDIISDRNYKCEFCGGRKKLQMHHIVGVELIINRYNLKTKQDCYSNKQLWDKNNIILLCQNCHLHVELIRRMLDNGRSPTYHKIAKHIIILLDKLQAA